MRKTSISIIAVLGIGILLAGILVRAPKDVISRTAGSADRPTPVRMPERILPPSFKLLDLSKHYNARLGTTWHPPMEFSNDDNTNNSLEAFPLGRNSYHHVPFDVYGIIQLAGKGAMEAGVNFPEQVVDIPVNAKCKTLYFLHATGWRESDGTLIGTFRIHYEGGDSDDIPIVYGKDVRDWWSHSKEPFNATNSVIAWSGTNPASSKARVTLRIFKSSWTNTRPQEAILSLEYHTTMSQCAPFLLAITVDRSNP